MPISIIDLNNYVTNKFNRLVCKIMLSVLQLNWRKVCILFQMNRRINFQNFNFSSDPTHRVYTLWINKVLNKHKTKQILKIWQHITSSSPRCPDQSSFLSVLFFNNQHLYFCFLYDYPFLFNLPISRGLYGETKDRIRERTSSIHGKHYW